MKAFIVLSIVIMAASCCPVAKHTEECTNFSVLNDLSNQLKIRPDADAILRAYHVENDKQQALGFRITPITDKRLHFLDEVYLEHGDICREFNKPKPIQLRSDKVQTFYNRVRQAIKNSNAAADAIDSLPYTDCYKTIIDELCTLSAKPGNRRILFVFSDLAENSSLYNSYSTDGRAMLMNNPKAVADSIYKHYPILEKILPTDMVIVYQSTTRANDELFFQWITVYSYLLKHVPVTIRFQATNKAYDL